MSNQQQQQMPMQNPRMMAARSGAFPVYGMPSRQVLMPMQSPMSQQPRMASQTRYIIARPPPQNNQAPPNNQQMHSSAPNMMQRHDGIVVSMSSGSQVYQQSSNQNPQIIHQINRNQPRPQVQMMQQQSTPPNQNYNNSSPYTPPQHPSTPQQQQYANQHQVEQRHYSQQPSTPQDRQVHQRIQQQNMQRPLTPQQQHAQSPAQRKGTPVMTKTNSMQGLNESNQQQDQHYVVQTSAPTSVYNVVQAPSSQPQVMHVGDGQQQEGAFNNSGQQMRPNGNNFQIRHPVTHRPLHFTNQSANAPIVRYSYPAGQQNQSSQSVVIQPIQQPRNTTRPNSTDRPQYIQVVRSEADVQGATYRIASSEPSYGVSSQPNVFYRSATSQQTNFAIRQALGHENSYQQQIQTSNAPVIIHSIDNSNGQLVYKMPNTMQRQPSSDNYESNNYIQASVSTVVETPVAEFAAEQQQPQRSNNIEDDSSCNTPNNQEDAPLLKKPKVASKPSTSKQTKVSKVKKAPVKTLAHQPILSTGTALDLGSEETTAEQNGASTKPIITKAILEQTAKSISQTLTLEEDAKSGIMMYMDHFVNKLIEETGRATNLRKSKHIQYKDLEYALRTKFNINPTNSTSSESVASKIGK